MLVEILNLLLYPLEFLISKKRATPQEIRQFYKSAAWKRVRYEVLAKSPRCFLCGRSAKDGARMNVDHIKPLSQRWDLRFKRRNLQTACASCNWGKGGR